MTYTIDLILALCMLLSGLLITLIGFDVIKLKTKNSVDEERMNVWRKRFGNFFKIAGIIVLTIGVYLIIMPNSNNKPENWTQSQKEAMKNQVINSSYFLKNMNPDSADLIVSCFVNKYTEKYTLKESWEQDKMTLEQLKELTSPLMEECFELYGIKTNK